MKKHNCILIFYLVPLKFIYSSLLNSDDINRLTNDEDIVYSDLDDRTHKKNYHTKFNSENMKFEIGDSLKILYKNYSSVEIGINDLLLLNKKEIINQYQIITLWEYLVNIKTGRNIELYGNNKFFIFEENSNDNKNHNKNTKNIANEGKIYNSLFTYIKIFLETIINSLSTFLKIKLKFNSDLNGKIDFNDKTKLHILKYIIIFLQDFFTHNNHVLFLIVISFGGIFFKITKFLMIIPKTNLFLCLVALYLNLLMSFLFYQKKFYFPSFINFCFFIVNIHQIYLCIIFITGNKDEEYNIFYKAQSKTEKIFYVKCFVLVKIILTIKYFSLFYFRRFYFYLIDIYFLNMLYSLLYSFYKNCKILELQPFENFIGFCFGLVNLISSNAFYYYNLPYNYDYNSFILINNIYSFYFILNLSDLIFCYKNFLGQIYIDNKDRENNLKNTTIFQRIKLHVLKNHNDNIKQNNIKYKGALLYDIDIVVYFFIISLLLVSFYFDSIFELFLAIYLYHTMQKNSFSFYSIKSKRIISSFFLNMFLFFIYNTKIYNLYYINQIVAINDENFILAIKLLIKLILVIITFFCFFLTSHNFGLYNIYNYTSYKYVIEEGINQGKNLNEETSQRGSSYNINERNKAKYFENNNIPKIYENLNTEQKEFNKIITNNFFDTTIKYINIDIDVQSNLISSYKNTSSNLNDNYNQASYNNLNNFTLLSLKIKEIYNINNSLDEIFCFSIEKSTSYINSILETLNFKNANSNKIDSVYIEFLILKSTKNINLFMMIIDYFLLYFKYWMLNFTVNDENQNNILIFILIQSFKFGILFKLFFIIFEYSKSKVQIITIIIMNTIAINRLITYFDDNIFDYYLLTLFINLNKVIYLYFIENSYMMNLFIFIISFIEYRRNKEIFLFCFLVCCLSCKSFFAYFVNLKYKKLTLVIYILIFILLFMFIQEHTIDNFYELFQENIIQYIRIDFIGILEYIAFNSFTIPSKYFSSSQTVVYIKRSSFLEEYYIREFLKYFIRYKIIRN